MDEPLPPTLPSAPTVPALPRVLEGKWELVEKLAEGGMGAVFRAKDLELGREVAIKTLTANLAGQPEAQSRFEREARLMAQLDHPNLVPIYAVGRDGGLPFIVMKLLGGQTLSARLKERGGRLEPSEAVTIAQQVLSGLGAMHERGVVHRDIKPGNILLGDDGKVTVLDLGIARAAAGALTRTGLAVGTPEFMSPEQATGAEDIDGRSDLYSLGAVLFTALAGRPVFMGMNDVMTMAAHANTPAPRLGSVAPEVPAALAAVVDLTLEKERSLRPASAREMARWLDEASRGHPPHLTPPQSGGWRTKSQASVSEPGTDPTRNARPSARLRAPPRRARVQFALGLLAVLVAAGGLLYARPATSRPPMVGSPVPYPAPAVAEPAAVVPEPAPPPSPEPAAPEPRPAPAPMTRAQTAHPPKPAPAAAGPSGEPVEFRVVGRAAGDIAWSYFWVDGVQMKNAPTTVQLAPGRHIIKLQRPGGQTIERVVELSAGKAEVLEVDW